MDLMNQQNMAQQNTKQNKPVPLLATTAKALTRKRCGGNPSSRIIKITMNARPADDTGSANINIAIGGGHHQGKETKPEKSAFNFHRKRSHRI